MATLNYEWQELDRVTFYSSGSTYDTVAIEGRVTGQSTQYNYSTIELRWKNVGSWWRTSNGTVSFTGTFTDSGGCATYPDRIETGDVFYTISKTVYHDNNGDATIYVGGKITAYVSGANRTGTISNVTVYLPHINRLATITGAVDFNDEGNPYMTFTNPGGFRINARLEFGNTNINRENISNTGTYTFTLTTAERNTLRQKCTGKTMTVRYVIATCYSGTTEGAWSTVDKTMTIVNGNPTFSVTYEDTNSTTTAITNNNQQIIQNNSTLQFNITNATALKYATLSSVAITINGSTQTQSISSSSLTFSYGTINVANDINASVVLTDSRGLTTTISVPLTVLSWSLPNAIITLNRKSNYYTETDIKVDANYSSLDSKNTITIQYRTKKKTASTWGSWSNLSDNVTTTFNADNQYEWDVQVKVTDLLGNTTYNLSLGIGIPIMFIDRQKRSVGIDCFPTSDSSLEVNGKTIFDMIYPVGSIYMSVNNVNPSTLFGGTWVAWGSGRVPVGVDSSTDFNSVEKTGGSKYIQQHQHRDITWGKNGTLYMYTGVSGSTTVFNLAGSGIYTSTYDVNSTNHIYTGDVDTNVNTGGSGNLQPYITCYMWKRTA